MQLFHFGKDFRERSMYAIGIDWFTGEVEIVGGVVCSSV